MTTDSENATNACEVFQQRLAEPSGSAEDIYKDPHLQGCTLCRALVVDLERIAEEARNLPGSRH
jgi:hypothetical protein